MAQAARFSTLVSMLESSCLRHAHAPLFGTRMADGWHWTTFERFAALVGRCRAGLATLGVKPGDRVAAISSNRTRSACT